VWRVRRDRGECADSEPPRILGFARFPRRAVLPGASTLLAIASAEGAAMATRERRRVVLDGLTRSRRPRALAPDPSRARLGAPSPVELEARARAAQRAVLASLMLLLVLAGPTLVRAVAASAVAHALAGSIAASLGGVSHGAEPHANFETDALE
jgi:hypothetical protein